MRNINRNPHIHKVKSIAQPNQNQRNNVMPNQFPKILSRLLELQQQHNGLLRPIARLQQIVRFEKTLVGSMRVFLEHSSCIKIPHWRPTHNIETERAKDGEIDGSVDLFHEAGLLCAGVNAAGDGEWADDSLHEKFAGERENDDVESHESKVAGTFVILNRSVGTTGSVRGNERGGGWEWVGEEESAVDGVAFGGIDEVEGDYEEGEDEWVHPCVSEREVSPAADYGAGFAAFAVMGGFGVGGALAEESR